MKLRNAGSQIISSAFFTIKAMSVILIIALLIFGVIGWNKYLSLDNKTTSLGFENISEFATQAAYCTTVNTEEAARNIWGIGNPLYSEQIHIQL